MSLSIIKKNNYLFIYLFVIVITNVLLQTLPLTNVFGYEFSAINALLLSFISGIYTISILKSAANDKKNFIFNQLFEAWLWMLSIPFVISIFNSLIFGFCSFFDGILFYLVITSPSVIIGSAIGSICFHFVKKFRIITFVFIYSLILFISVLEIYFNPQVYLYNPLFAYFPGTIYDEGINVDLKLTAYRFFNFIFFIAILKYFIGWSRKLETFNRRLTFSLTALLISGGFYFFISPSLGYTTTESSLTCELSNRIESTHFIIQADSRIEKTELKLIVLHQEYYFEQLKDYFKEIPSGKINSFIFFDSEQKRKLFGAGSADVAKPWLNSIYISADTWESTLKHEIAHCFTAGFGTGVFKLASGFNPALIEGVAEAADGIYNENDIHYLASLAYKNDFIIDINSMFSSFSFFGSVSTLSYIYSGSFIKYLVSEYGIEKVKSFYGNGNFKESFSMNLDSVITKYEIFLDTLTTYSTKDEAIYYFGRKPLISKVCPRYFSSALTEGWDYFSSEKFEEAESIFNKILSKSENYSAVVGLSKIYEEEDSLEKAINILESYINTFSATSNEYDLQFRLADLYVKNDELNKAQELYTELEKAKPITRLQLVSLTRLSLIKSGFVKKYIQGSDIDRYEILKKLNLKSYNYATIPSLIDLSESLQEDYELFLSYFENDFRVTDRVSSYAMYNLSEYMLKNFDFVNARKMSGIALRFKGDPDLKIIVEQQSQKVQWFLKNSEQILNETEFE